MALVLAIVKVSPGCELVLRASFAVARNVVTASSANKVQDESANVGKIVVVWTVVRVNKDIVESWLATMFKQVATASKGFSFAESGASSFR